ncbi:hypothetical protein V2J09_014483 [Rumex salicifolius]
MSRRIFRLILSASKPLLLPPVPLYPSTPNSSRLYSIFSLLQSHNFSTSTDSSSSSAAPESLDGLFGPGEPYYETVSPEDFAFLRPDLVSDASCSPAGKFSDDAILILDALNSSYDANLLSVEAERRLRQFREKLHESLVVEVLCLVKNPKLGVQFFLWTARQIGYAHTRPVYDALVKLIGSCGSDRVPEDLLREIRDDDRELLQKLMNVVVQKCCRSGRWNLALEELGRLKDFGYKPSKLTYLALARVFLEAGKLDTAVLIHREMVDGGVKMDLDTLGLFAYSLCKAGNWREALDLIEKEEVVPDTILYTRMISGLCEASLFDEAMDLLNRMRCGSCMPNVVTYRTLLCGCLNKRQLGRCKRILSLMMAEGCYPDHKIFHSLAGNTERACQIYSRMQGYKSLPDVDRYFGDNDENVIQPNVFTYGALVDGLCKAHKVKEAGDLLVAMTADGVEPNQIVYDALIDGLCKVGKLDEAQKVFSKMSEHGYSPTEHTYGSLIDKMFKDKRLDLALKVLSKMLEDFCAPNVVIYTEMIDGLCKVGKIEEAYKLMLMMNEKGCRPNVVTYTAILDGYGKANKVDKCLELFSEMVQKGCSPNYVTYRVLIKHCCNVGFLDDAYCLLEEMKQTYWPMHISSYQKVIEGFSRDFLTALDLIDVLSDNNDVPIAPVYQNLIDSFCKAGKLDRALELCREIPYISDSSALAQTYSLLIKSLCLASRVDQAFQLFADLGKQGVTLDSLVFFTPIMELIKLNQWEVALELSYRACHSYYSVFIISPSLPPSLKHEEDDLQDDKNTEYQKNIYYQMAGNGR